MLHPEHFILIVAVMLALLVAWVMLLGVASRRRNATASERPQERRDVIAEGVITERDVDEMLAAENARLRAHGHSERTRAEPEARLVGDQRYRWRLMRLRQRRPPERA